MISTTVFLEKIRQIQSEAPQYKRGGFGLRGVCDCIGLIIGALRRANAGWGNVHGSNYAFRNEMQRTTPIRSVDDLEEGWAVYKFHPKGHAKNRLPSSYRGHPDQNDYYHVGVVDSVHPLRILHCTSWKGGSGVKVDTRIGTWAVGGPLSRVSSSGSAPAPPPADYHAPVVAIPVPAAVRTLRVIKGVPLMRGEDVREVQRQLLTRGYSVGPKGADGIYGWDTHRAVLAFQVAAFPANASDWDGVVGARTRAKLGVGA